MPFYDKDGNEVQIDASLPEIKTLLESAVAEATKGLKGNRDQILQEKAALEAQVKEVTSQWGDMDPKIVKSLIERMANDEETKLIAEGKIDEVLDRRTSGMKKEYEKKIEALTGEREQLGQKTETLNGKLKRMLIEGMVHKAAGEHEMLPSAVEDAIYRATNVFQIDDEDRPVAKNSDGTVIVGKDAKSPISVSEWLGNMKENAPHWFKSSQGAGAAGGRGEGPGSGFTLTREEARNPSKYQAAKAAAEKAGQTLQIVSG